MINGPVFVRAALLLAVGVVLFTLPVSAFHDPIVVVPRGPEIAEIEVNGTTVIRLRGPDAPARAAGVADRLRGARLTRSSHIAVRILASSPVLFAGTHPILTVDRTLAASAGEQPLILARVWAAQLRQALAAPRVAVDPKRLSLIPGERVLVRVHVFPASGLIIGRFNPKVIALRRERDGLVVTAKALGATMIPLRAARGGRADIPVAVRTPAAALPRFVDVEVSGDPADPQLVQEAIRHAVLRDTSAHPGSHITVGSVDGGDLAPGETTTVTVPVSVRNPFARNVYGIVRVTVRNVVIPLQTPARLLVSNRPEVVTANGVLFSQILQTGDAARLLYHHQNGAENPKLVTITLTNPHQAAARMLIIGAAAGPSTDLMFAGQAATSRFLRRLLRQQGYVIDVPGGRAHTFTVHEMPPGSLVSGLLQVQALAGELHLAVHVRSLWLLAGTITSAVNQPAYPHPHGTFDVSEFPVTLSMTSRDTVPLVDLGVAVSPVDATTGVRLVGDYGIIYRLSIEVRNLLGVDESVVLAATALGGAARGIFYVDADVIDAGVLRPGQEQPLATLNVPAGQTRTITIVTMAVAGSFYPVRLTLRPESSSP